MSNPRTDYNAAVVGHICSHGFAWRSELGAGKDNAVARFSREMLVTVAAGAAGVAAIVTPGIASWWRRILWCVATVAALLWYLGASAAEGPRIVPIRVHVELREFID